MLRLRNMLMLLVVALLASCGPDHNLLVAVEVTPTNPAIAAGTDQQFEATAIYANSQTKDVTALATWGSSAPGVATVDVDGLAASLIPGSTMISATYGSETGSSDLTVSAATLQTLDVSPTDPAIANGTTAQFTALGTFSDSSTQDLTSSVTWDSTDPLKATISNDAGSHGLASSQSVGTTTISAASGAVSDSTTLTITAATLVSLAITPVDPSLSVNPPGTFLPFTATGTFTDSSTQDLTTSVTWDSSAPGVADISNLAGTNGVATTVTPGTTTITATSGAISDTSLLTVTNATLVTITVTPVEPQPFLVGDTVQFAATGTYDDASTQDLTTLVTWESSLPAAATVSNGVSSKGLATGVDVGIAVISATSGAISDATTLEVELP